MRLVHKIVLGIFAFMSLGFSVLLAAHLYTKAKVETLTSELTGGMSYRFGDIKKPSSLPAPLMLCDVLLSNIHAQAEDGEYMSGGAYTPESYKTGFRALLANNPNLAYTAWDLYGQNFITSFNGKLKKIQEKKVEKYANETYRTDTSSRMTQYVYQLDKEGNNKRVRLDEKIEVFTYKTYSKKGVYKSEKEGYNHHYYYPLGALRDSLNEFSTFRFWEQQKVVIAKYQLLMEELLKLNEAQLEKYMNEINGEFTTYNWEGEKTFQKWLISKKLLPPLPEGGYKWDGDALKEGAWNLWNYPIDYLFLASRVNKDYPEKWPYKSFIKESKNFLEHVTKTLP